MSFRLDAADLDRLAALAKINRNSVAAELRRAIVGHLGLLNDERPLAGLPHATGDIGNWTEPLGLASLFVEAAAMAIAAGAYIVVPRQLGSSEGPRSLRTVMADAA